MAWVLSTWRVGYLAGPPNTLISPLKPRNFPPKMRFSGVRRRENSAQRCALGTYCALLGRTEKETQAMAFTWKASPLCFFSIRLGYQSPSRIVFTHGKKWENVGIHFIYLFSS